MTGPRSTPNDSSDAIKASYIKVMVLEVVVLLVLWWLQRGFL
jgi:hypothetical protein